MSNRFQVVTHGLSGTLTKAVSAERLRQLHLSDVLIGKLLDHSVVLKKGLEQDQAKNFEDKLQRAGLTVELRPEQKPTSKTAARGLKNTGNLKNKVKGIASFTQKLKQGISAKIQQSSIPQLGQTLEDNDVLINDDEEENASKALKQQQNQAAMPNSTSGSWRGPHDVDKLFHSEMPKVKMPVSLPIHDMKAVLFSLLLPGLYFLLMIFFIVLVISNSWSALTGTASIFTFIAQMFFTNMVFLIIIVFLAKPLLKLFKGSHKVLVGKHECPELYWLVTSICKKLKILPPESISLDMTLDMRITYNDGIKGFMANKSHLIIGAPLTQSLSTSEFVGILAHTLGHLRQPFSGKSYFITRTANAWLFSASKDDDFLDNWIEHQLEKNEILVISEILLNSLQKMFNANKSIMAFILKNHIKLLGGNARALDFHADQFATVIIGSDSFEQLALEYRKVIMAFEQSHNINDQLMVKNQLLQDIPEVIGSLVQSFNSRIETTLKQDIEQKLTYTWEPHPADWERIDKSNFLQASAIFFCDQHMKDLMPNLHPLGVKATKAYYQHLGINTSEYTLARPKF